MAKSPHVCEPASVQRQPVMSCKAGCSRSDLGKGKLETACVNALLRIEVSLSVLVTFTLLHPAASPLSALSGSQPSASLLLFL